MIEHIVDADPVVFDRARYFIDGPVGALEVYFEPASQAPGATAVLCAPNPAAGGTMGHKVIHVTARALRRCGLHTVRFNYRGAGRSEGTHGVNGEEREDVDRVLRHATRYTSAGAPILLAGFSFGTWVGLPVGEKAPIVERMIALGVPIGVRSMGADDALSRGQKPLLIIQGTDDEFGDRDRLEECVRRRQGPTQLVWIECGHFFHGKMAQIEAAIAGWLT